MGTHASDLLARLDMGELGRALLEAAGAARMGVTITLLEDGHPRNVYVSDFAADLLGWSVEELLERDPFAPVAARERDKLHERLALRTRGEKGLLSYQLLTRRKDGTETPIQVTASLAMMQGKPAVVAFLTEANAAELAHEQRVRNDARFRGLIESAPEPIGIIRDGHFVYVNRAYLTVLGCPDAGTLYATPLSTILEPDDAALRAAREANTLQRKTVQPPHTYNVRRFDGSTVLLEVSSCYFEYDGKPAVLGMARDVTARRQLERQLVQGDRLAALGTMAAGVAHEVNNPLAYLMLNLEWIARKLPSLEHDPAGLAGLMTMLEEARQGAERVSAIVRELRSFSRADGETRASVDMASVAQSAIKIAGHEIRHKARILTSFEASRPVWANEARLEQVVINLLLNAAQALSDDEAERNEIRVSVREDVEGRSVLEVFDNGDGIPPEVLPRIFDPFFTTKPVGVGTGLGLSICHGIVTSLGGQIAAYSEPGEGTTFRVVLPTHGTHVGEESRSPSEAPPSHDARKARVLVVDDEPPIANTLRELLGPENEVLAATTVRDALALAAQEDFDIIFCDLIMPGSSGIDFFGELRARRPGQEKRIVFMTGGAFTARTAEFLSSVTNRRIEKPFDLGVIEQLVREAARGVPAGEGRQAR